MQMHEPLNQQQGPQSPCCSPLTSPIPPTMPGRLPAALSAILQPSPQNARPAVAMNVFSALRALMKEVEFLYIDNRHYEPSFMNLLIAEHAHGKSAISPPLMAILHDVLEQDEKSRREDQQWREKCQQLGANKQRPPAPVSPIRCVMPDMTNPALVRLAKRASPYSLWSYSEEIEQMFRLKGVSEVVRSAYDSATYGQERVGVQSVSEVTRLRWSFNVSTTPATAQRMLRNDIVNGTLSRLSLSTIIMDEDDWGEETPQYGDYDRQYRESISAYTYHLLQAQGPVECPEAIEWTLQEKVRQIDTLRQMDAKHLLPFLWRSLQMGFWRACILYLMHQCRWSNEIAEFASWSVCYDLWCKIYYFGPAIERLSYEAVEERRGPASLLALLPDEFTREQAQEMRRLQGRSITPKALQNMLGQWSYRNFIRYDPQRNTYIKTNQQ